MHTIAKFIEFDQYIVKTDKMPKYHFEPSIHEGSVADQFLVAG